MKKIFGRFMLIIILLPITIFAAFNPGDVVCVSNAGNTASNGTYFYHNSSSLYQQDNSHDISFTGTTYVLNLSGQGTNYSTNNSYTQGTVSELIGASFTGFPPSPVITQGTCNSSTAVPITPLGLLMLLSGTIGSAFVGLRRKRA